MTYRDDREALLHRAAALEREAERLRRENEALAAERDTLARERAKHDALEEAEAAEDASRRAELERLAAKPVRAAPVTAVEPAAARARRPARTERDKLIDHSLVGRWSAVTLAVLLPLSAAMALCGFLLFHHVLSIFALYLSVLASLLMLIPAYRLAGRFEARAGRRWIAELELPLDRTRYLDLLGRKYQTKVVTLRVTFAAPVADDDRELLARVVIGAAPNTGASWDGEGLVITSPAIKTLFYAKSGADHDNRRIHRWFTRMVRRGLRPIARAHPLARVDLS